MRRATPEHQQRLTQYNKRVRVWKDGKRCIPHWDVLLERDGDSTTKWVDVPPLATECHHMGGRDGQLLLKEAWWLPVCHFCHLFLTSHAEWAFKHGYRVRINYR